MKRFLLTCATLIIVVAGLLSSRSENATTEIESAEKMLRGFGGIQPRIAPNGHDIAFSCQGAIWRIPRSGGTMTRLTSGQGFDIAPAWSPDGKQIAYINTTHMGDGDLKLMDARTGTPIPLPQAVEVYGRRNHKLAFFPDGKRLLGNFRRDGKRLGLATYDLASGDVSAIPNMPGYAHCALSPDGKTIVYTTMLDVGGQQSGNNGPQSDLYRISSEGGTAELLGRFPSRIYYVCFAGDNESVFVAADLGNVHYDVWRLRLDDVVGSATKVTFGQADEDRPSVSRDGRWLVYTDNRRSTTSLVARDLSNETDEIVSVQRIDFSEPTGTLKLRTVDGGSQSPLVARVSIERDNGKYFAPFTALHRLVQDYGHFYCDRRAELTLPAGTYRIRALRGPEYRATYQDVQVKPGTSVPLTIPLKRWTHAAHRGWYSGENHIHANYGYGEWYNTPTTMLAQCSGEDLNVCNFMVANSDTDGVFDREFFRGGPDPISTDETILYWNQEFRSTIWGHMTLVNLKQVVEPVFTGFKNTTNPWDIPTNSDVADRAHWQNGLVNYTHVAFGSDDPYTQPYSGKSIPIDVALGKIDTMDINYHYSGSVPLWYRFLNCGFRLPASAGTDCFVNRIRSRLPGADRVYVKIDGPLSYPQWIEGLRAGRSFVTNSPMLDLQAGGQGPGETIQLTAAGEVRIKATAESQFPLEKVELVYNGKVVATADLSDNKHSGSIEQAIPIKESGWLALRAEGPGHADHPLKSQNSHTSPIYIDVAGKPKRSREDAEYFLKWIDRISLDVRLRNRIPNEALKQHVRDQLESARSVYRTIASEAD